MKRYLLPTLAIATLAIAPACGRKQSTTSTVQTAPVVRRDIVVDAQANGVVEPVTVVEVKSKASGMITRMNVETGTMVRPGDLLAQIDTRDVQNQYNQALADERAAEARLQVSSAQKKRSDEMYNQRVITAQEHETAALDYANAQAAVIRANASTDLAKQRLEDATVTSPVAGTVIERTVSQGMVITGATGNSASGGTTLLKMADLSRVRMRAQFNETDIGQIRAGQVAIVIVDAYPERRFNGLVEKIEPQAVVTQGVTMFPVLVTLNNMDGALKPGMNGEVQVQIDQRLGVLSVPNDAIKNTREAVSTAPLLGLDADSVQAQIRSQFGSGRGMRGNNANGAPQSSANPRVSSSPGEVELPQQGPGGFQMPEVSDKQCADVKAAMDKKPDQVKKLDGLRERMRNGEIDRQAMMQESQAIYAAIGVDARVSMACRRRDAGNQQAGANRGAIGGAPTQQKTATSGGSVMRNAADTSRAGVAGLQPQLQIGGDRSGTGSRVRPGVVFVKKGTTWEPRMVMLGAANFDYTEVVSGLQEGEEVALLAALSLQAQRQQQNDRMRQNMGGGVPGMSGGGAGGNQGGGQRPQGAGR
jgi:RND family efflux transporter MFP subunit